MTISAIIVVPIPISSFLNSLILGNLTLVPAFLLALLPAHRPLRLIHSTVCQRYKLAITNLYAIKNRFHNASGTVNTLHTDRKTNNHFNGVFYLFSKRSAASASPQTPLSLLQTSLLPQKAPFPTKETLFRRVTPSRRFID